MTKAQERFVQALSELNRVERVEVEQRDPLFPIVNYPMLTISTVALSQEHDGTVRVGALWIDGRFAVAWVVDEYANGAYRLQNFGVLHEAISAANSLVWGL